MTLATKQFKASELCSRKLWQLVNDETGAVMTAGELEQAIEELASRRHYLAELMQIGKLETDNKH